MLHNSVIPFQKAICMTCCHAFSNWGSIVGGVGFFCIFASCSLVLFIKPPQKHHFLNTSYKFLLKFYSYLHNSCSYIGKANSVTV